MNDIQIRQYIQRKIEETYDEEITWETEFKKTKRENSLKEVKPAGNTRDTRDLSLDKTGSAQSFEVVQLGINGITIINNDPDWIFIDKDRPELIEYIEDNLDVEYLASLVIANHIKKLNV